MLSIMVAVADNGVIGKDNQLVWKIKKDRKYFRQMTLGKKIIMGRKTFEGFPKPRPDRKHIVLTRSKAFSAPEGVEVIHEVEEARAYGRTDEEVFVIGGGETFSKLIDDCQRLYITWVHQDFEGDTYFPVEKIEGFRLVESRDEVDEESGIPITFTRYEKKA